MTNENMQCPKCGCTEIGYGKQGGYATVNANGKLNLGSPMMFVICTDCGYILESYVTKPNKFKGTTKY